MKSCVGADGENIDCYIGPNPKSKNVYIIDQIDPDTGKFDEHKVMLGYDDSNHALAQYHKAFSDGRGVDRVGAVTPIHIDGLKKWLKTNATKKPAMNSKAGIDSVAPAKNNTARFLAIAERRPVKLAAVAQ